MKRILTNIWFIARHDVAFALRDRATLLWLVLMPPVFFFFIGNMTAGGFGAMMQSSEIVIEAPADTDATLDRLTDLLASGGFALVEHGGPRLVLPAAGEAPVATYFPGDPTPTTDFGCICPLACLTFT